MKLNNHGWGYRQMIIMSAILLIFLLFAAYNIFALYNNLDVSEATIYANLEGKLTMAAAGYINERELHDQTVILSLRDLSKEISAFEDGEGRSCSGYVIYENNEYNAYIDCPEYTTKNYNKNYE